MRQGLFSLLVHGQLYTMCRATGASGIIAGPGGFWWKLFIYSKECYHLYVFFNGIKISKIY